MDEGNVSSYCELDTSYIETGNGIILTICFLVLEFLIFFGNGLVICAVIRVRSLHTTTNYLITSLALSDLLLAIVVLPFSSVSTLTETWNFGYAWCQIWLASDVWLCTASIYNVVAISYDRYMAVKQPLKYKLINSERMGRILVIAAWLVSFAISLPPLVILPLVSAKDETMELVLQNSSSCVCTPMDNNDGYIVYSAVGSFFLPLALIIALNARIYAKVRTFGQTLKTGWRRTVKTPAAKGSIGEGTSDDGMSMRVSRGGRNSVCVSADHKLSVSVQVNGHQTPKLIRDSSLDSPPSQNTASSNRKKASNQYSPKYHASPRPLISPSGTFGKRRHSEGFDSQTFQFKSKQQVPWSLNSRSRYSSGQKLNRNCPSPISQLVNTDTSPCSRTLYEEGSGSGDNSLHGDLDPLSLGTESTRVSQCSSPKSKVSLSLGVHHNGKYSSSSENVTTILYGRKMSVADKLLTLRQRSIFCRGNQLDSTEARVMRTVGIVVGCYIIFWMPFAFCYSLQAFDFCGLRNGCMPETLFNVCFWLGYTNSALNPILYALTSKEFRRGFKMVLRNPFWRKGY